MQDRGVSKVFADGGTRGDTLRDRLKELTLPDLLEIAGKSEGRGAALRPEPGAFPGPGTARRLPLPHAQGRPRDKGLTHKTSSWQGLVIQTLIPFPSSYFA
ncbi:MAG: hypothetical protein OXC93_04270 [Rhodospirillaceae bacterium]|nr:hypothetical protein [Rhodospirillaceae bacterium]